MAFCANCGFQVQKHDKFCPRCGVATRKDYFADSNVSFGRKESYDGELKKCPNCGQVLNSFTPNCPSCGYELRNIAVAKSVKELSYKIQQIEATKPRGKGIKSRLVRAEIDNEITNIITSFPIPNTKEDILEFLIIASSNADVSKAWEPKVEQAYEKAKSTLGLEPDFYQIDKIYRKYKRKRRWEATEDLRAVLVLFLILAAIFSIIGFVNSIIEPKRNQEEESRLETIVQEANSALEDHNYKLALRIIESMKYKANDRDRERWWGIKKETMIDEIIEEAHKAGIELERPTEEPTTTSMY